MKLYFYLSVILNNVFYWYNYSDYIFMGFWSFEFIEIGKNDGFEYWIIVILELILMNKINML